jgi:hypothetical protein
MKKMISQQWSDIVLYYRVGWGIWDSHKVRRPQINLFYQRRMMMSVGQSVEWELAGETVAFSAFGLKSWTNSFGSRAAEQSYFTADGQSVSQSVSLSVESNLGVGVGVLLAADSQSTSSSGYWASLWDPWPDFSLLFFLRETGPLLFFGSTRTT